jgi:hypothetical protein
LFLFIQPVEAREDFVEIIANYLVKSDNDWDRVLKLAGDEGKEKIQLKLEIISDWLKTKWDIDIEVMRKEILYRQEQIKDDFFNKDL